MLAVILCIKLQYGVAQCVITCKYLGVIMCN